MKKNLLLFIILSTIFFISCENDGESKLNSRNNEVEAKQYKEKYAFIGEVHNHAMNDILNMIQSTPKVKSSKKDFQSEAKKYTLIAIENIKHDGVDIVDKELKLDLTSRYFDSPSSMLKRTKTEMELTTSQEFDKILNELLDLSNNYNLSVEEFNAEGDELDRRAIRDVKDIKEVEVYFIGSSVARASYEYWVNNIYDWAELINTENGISTKSIYGPGSGAKPPYNHWLLENLVESDIACGVAGAFVGAFGAGAGAVVGGLLGACGGSSGQVIVNITDAIF